MSNMYFLVLTLMECYRPISDSGGYPVLAFPLSFVVGVSMLKDVYEDYQRHQADKEENHRKAAIAKPRKDIEEPSSAVRESVESM